MEDGGAGAGSADQLDPSGSAAAKANHGSRPRNLPWDASAPALNPRIANCEVHRKTVTLLDGCISSLRILRAWQSPIMLLQNYILRVV